MRIDSIDIKPDDPLVRDYQEHFATIEEKFNYNPFDQNTYHARHHELMQRSFQREKLADTLLELNQNWGAPRSTTENIERLKHEESTVVIGGQQAGLLTGPLYTVHKIISILQLAKRQEEKLNKPVIPVFWIAGEDHDFAEINHVFIPEQKQMRKLQTAQKVNERVAVSDLNLDQNETKQWLARMFGTLNETEYTKDLYRQLSHDIDHSKGFADFFARLVFRMFHHEGIVLMDSHHPSIRELETEYFSELIRQSDEIGYGVHRAVQANQQAGYPVSLECRPSDLHLFYHMEGERVLLKQEEDRVKGKQDEVTMTFEQMLEIAYHDPTKLSNNVVTRPLMQECLFPTLAFVGGPGEISYWSVLKPAFNAIDRKMPPVVLRQSFTLIDRKAERLLDEYHIQIEDAIEFGVGRHKMSWLSSQSSPPIEQMINQAKQEIDRIHEPLRYQAREMGDDLGQVADKNLAYIYQDIAYLRQRMERRIDEQYAADIENFDYLELLLHPGKGRQERKWNVLPWINAYGLNLFSNIQRHDLSIPGHHVIYV
ncbi:bacillithiol biosynthesis cysteine-adding enzyme BshC [Thalassobacillus sp. CUG 92003]|uniref:bacillithiol biosynthesis cysteine-adding enzyme BshC n=1 Tax=Thalassobacillus sp. CUG 92003 TaxID=2736641 RepID=UPI0015E6C54E|nr:bacillithiol biosynthesis cysteine-adding enzyme BshC [Thalassobacillus sp. CUG 92003]